MPEARQYQRLVQTSGFWSSLNTSVLCAVGTLSWLNQSGKAVWHVKKVQPIIEIDWTIVANVARMMNVLLWFER